MILIFSKNNEFSSTEVIKWLIAFEKPFIRVHEDEYFEIRVLSKRIYLRSEQNGFYLDDITSVWYRRGGLKFMRGQYNNPNIHRYMSETAHWLEDYVRKTLESKKHVNKESNSNVNKLLVLEKAIAAGLDVPSYFLSEDCQEVAIGETIVKPITGNPMIEDIIDNYHGMMYTSLVEEFVDGDFYPSFFQERIEKDFEIRSFYLNGETFSTAIISQNDEQTQLDSRRYNTQKPNRTIRYQLPLELEEKIKVLMDSMDLNSGSLDFIKSGDRYYFLEINAIGQFLGYSIACNYQIEKKIAAYL